MLCALGAIVFAAGATTRLDRLGFAAGFGVGAFFTSGSNLPDPVWMGTLAGLASAVHLFKPRLRFLTFGVGGAFSGCWAALLEVQGLPGLVALVVAAGFALGTLWLSQSRPSFAPDLIREEAVLAIGVLGLGVALMPGILDGWQAARNLSGASERVESSIALPMWTLALVLTSLSLGGLYSVWSRR
jgi:hypothetical protein